MNKNFFSYFLFPICLLLITPSVSFAMVEIFLDPVFRDVNVGDTFIVTVRIKTDSDCLNAIRSEIRYDPTQLKVVDWGTGQSLISLWTESPKIDSQKGTISFAGGIPGGYCGRVTGDPGLTNILGKIVFSTPPDLSKGTFPLISSVDFNYYEILLNDGMGTRAEGTAKGTQIRIDNKREGVINEWLSEVRADTTAPELFTINIYRDPKIQDGKYFIAWTTTDKQSGLDHYEVFETNPWRFGFFQSSDQMTYWQRAESPYILKDQNLRSKIMVKAIDKTGNERISEYNPRTSLLPGIEDKWIGPLGGFIAFIIIIGIYFWRASRKKKNNEFIPPINLDLPL